MPVIIRELNIRVNVSRNQPEEEASPPAGATTSPLADREEIIGACVEQVMELLKLQKER